MSGFPVQISQEGQFVRMQAIDLPRAFAVGTTIEHALRQMRHSINRGLHYHMKEGRPLPLPSSARGLYIVRPGIAWRLRLTRLRWREKRAELRRRFAAISVRFDRGSRWSMPAVNSLLPCTLFLA